MFDVLALVRTDGVKQTVEYVGRGILIVFLVVGILKCRSISRRQTTCTSCVVGLMLVLLGCIALLARGFFSYFPGAVGLGPFLWIIAFVVAFLAIVAGIVMGVKGIACYQDHAAHRQGRTQAVLALVLAAIVLGTTLSQAGKNKELPEGHVLTYPDFGFRYRAPAGGYSRVGGEKASPPVRMTLVRSDPIDTRLEVSVAPVYDAQTDLNKMADRVENELKLLDKNASIYSRDSHTVNGMRGIRLRADMRSEGSLTTNTHWIYLAEGICYQLKVSGPKIHKKLIHQETGKLLAGFEFTGAPRNTIALNRPCGTFGRFNSPRFGYSVDLRSKPWDKWNDVKDEFPAAEVGGSRDGDTVHFIIKPIFYNGVSRPHLDALMWSALQSIGIEYPGGGIRDLKSIGQADVKGYTLSYSSVVDGQKIEQRMKILSGPKRGLLIWAWGVKGDAALDARAGEVFDAIVVRPLPSDAAGMAFSDEEIKAQAKYINWFGVSCYRARQYGKAMEYFSRAVELNDDDLTYLTNTLEVFYVLGQHKRALTYLDKCTSPHKREPEVRSWKARYLAGSGQTETAIELFKVLFNKEYRDDEDFTYYMGLLTAARLWDQADKAADAYLKRGDSLVVQLERAKMFSSRGKHKQALELLQRQQKGIPFNTQIAYAIINTHMDLDQPKEALKLCRALIDNGYESSDAHYAMGQAHCELKWYRKAKTSFETALRLSPEDKATKQYLQYVSGLLGEGGNSTIKDPIDPVPLPKTLADRIARPTTRPAVSDYGACYAALIDAFAYTRDKDFRHTRYRKIKILDNSGISRFSTLRVTFDGVYERVFVNKLIVLDADGKVISRGKTSDYYVVDAAADQVASNDRTLNVPVPSIRPGCTIEFTVTVRQVGKIGEFPLQRQIMATGRPVGICGVYFAGDPDSIRHKTINASGPRTVDGGLVWVITDPPVYRWEPRQVPVEKFLPVVCLADAGGSWASVGREYLSRIVEKLESDQKVRDLSGQLTTGLETRAEKINALVKYLETNCTYKAIEFGVRAQIPNTAAKTLSNRYGDCKDHALLAHQLLKFAGIASNLALVNTEWKVHKSLPSLGQFNHMILHVPDSTGGRFIDTVDKGNDPARKVPAGLAGKTALILDEGNTRLTLVGPYPPGCSTVRCQRKINLAESGELTITETVALSGYAAGGMRDLLKAVDSARHAQYVQGLLASYLESATVRRIKVRNLFDNARGLEIDIDYVLKGRFHKTSGGMELVVPCVWGRHFLGAQPVSGRRTPFMTRTAFTIETATTVNVPDGMEIVRPERMGYSGATEFAKWRTSIEVNRKSCTTRMSCTLGTGTFKAAQYADYHAAFDRLLSRASPRLRLKSLKGARAK